MNAALLKALLNQNGDAREIDIRFRSVSDSGTLSQGRKNGNEWGDFRLLRGKRLGWPKY